MIFVGDTYPDALRHHDPTTSGVRGAADLYRPDSGDQPVPCVVMGHGGAGIKRSGCPGDTEIRRGRTRCAVRGRAGGCQRVSRSAGTPCWTTHIAWRPAHRTA